MIALLLGAVLAPGAAAAPRHRTLYAVVTRAQFVNVAGPVTQGNLTNPFNVDSGTLKPPKSGKGRLPGNSALFAVTLYAGADLQSSVGTGIYTCTYQSHHTGICEADYELHGGSLLGSGYVDFSKKTFALAITGGTKGYLGASGQVVSTPVSGGSSPNETRLALDLTR